MNKARVNNLLGAAPLLAWYVWGLSDQLPLFAERLATLHSSVQTDALLALQTISQTASITFISFLVVLLIVRDAPKSRVQGIAPYMATIIGTFSATIFPFLQPADLSVSAYAIATTLVMLGFGLSLYALIYLGRAFAVLPSARALVTDGPYRFVRHPLYLFEELAIIGIAMQFAQPWSVLILVIHFAAQLARMRYEERALAEAFPEYSSYTTRTTRFIPRVY